MQLSQIPPGWQGARRAPRRQLTPSPWINADLSDYDVAEIDADTELDPLVFRGRSVALGHPALQRKRAGDRLDDARELGRR